MDTYILTYKGNTVLWVCVHLCITCQERVKNGVHSGYGVGPEWGLMRWVRGLRRYVNLEGTEKLS